VREFQRQHADQEGKMLFDAQFLFLPGSDTGPCTVEYRWAEASGSTSWGNEELRVRARYDEFGRLVVHERWDIFGDFDFRTTVEYSDGGASVTTTRGADETVRRVVERTPRGDGLVDLVEHHPGAQRTMRKTIDARGRLRWLVVEAKGAERVFTAAYGDDESPFDILEKDAQGLMRPVARLLLDPVDRTVVVREAQMPTRRAQPSRIDSEGFQREIRSNTVDSAGRRTLAISRFDDVRAPGEPPALSLIRTQVYSPDDQLIADTWHFPGRLLEHTVYAYEAGPTSPWSDRVTYVAKETAPLSPYGRLRRIVVDEPATSGPR
jgi:hypothetical protein